MALFRPVGRKQTQDDSPEVFQQVTAQLADALSAAAAPLLAPAAAAELDYDGEWAPCGGRIGAASRLGEP